MIVKEPQPQLRTALALVCAQPPWGATQETAQTVEMGQGRIAQWTRTVSAALAGVNAWPGLCLGLPVGAPRDEQKDRPGT